MNELELDPITTERAKELWETRETAGAPGVTPAEDRYVSEIWKSMPGETSWMDAFFRVLNGEVKYYRERHGAHYQYTGEARDIETWHVLDEHHTTRADGLHPVAELRLPPRRSRPSWVPADAEYHCGYLDAQKRQVWIWIRSIPAPICSTCNRCNRATP